MGQHRPRHVHHAKDVGIELPTDLFVGLRLEWPDEAIAGVVDQNIDLAKFLFGGSYGRFDGALVRDVEAIRPNERMR